MRSLRVAAFAAAAALAAAACPPQQFWVNYGDSPSDMVVSWATWCSSDASVAYGTSSNGLGLSVNANTTNYSFGPYNSPFLHHAVLPGLALNTVYYYKVGGVTSGFSGVMNFTTHPGVGATIPYTWAVVGDLGTTSNSESTVQHMMQNPAIQGVTHVGDLSYADDTGNWTVWDVFQEMVQPLSQSTPWMTIGGNHEVEDDYATTFVEYTQRFRMPYVYPGSPAAAPSLYYSYDVGSVHWVMLSTYSPYNATSQQFAWLQKDLASVNRAVTPWVFVTFHAPWFSSNYAHQGEAEPLRLVWEDVLFNAGVDMVFTGHVHAYERTERMYNFTANPAGPYYITIGDGGNLEGLAIFWMNPQPAWSAFRDASYGHGELQVFNATHAFWSWHQNPDLEPTIADSLWVIKGQ